MSSQVYGQSVGLLNQLYVLSSQVYGQCVSGQPGVCSVQSVVWSVSDLVSQVYVLFSQVFGHSGVWSVSCMCCWSRCVVSQLICCQLPMRSGVYVWIEWNVGNVWNAWNLSSVWWCVWNV